MGSVQQRTTGLSKTLLRGSVVNKVKSRNFMKKITTIILSTIATNHIDLSLGDFSQLAYKDIPYKIIKQKVRAPELQMFHSCINGISKAIDKDNLTSIFILICNAQNPSEIFEYYKLNFDYTQEALGIVDNFIKTLSQQTQDLLLQINNVKEEKYSKDDVILRVFLTCDCSPEDEPSGSFKLVQDINFLTTARDKAEMEKEGFQVTRVTSRFQGLEYLSRKPKPNDTTVDNKELTDNVEAAKENDEKIVIGAEQTVTTIVDVHVEAEHQGNHVSVFNCSCNTQWKSPYIHTIKCKACLTYQHGICQGYLDAHSTINSPPYMYICSKCRNKYSNKNMITYSLTCLTVAYICVAKSFPADLFQILSAETQGNIYKVLQNEKIVQQDLNASTINVPFAEKMLPNMVKRLKEVLDQSMMTNFIYL